MYRPIQILLAFLFIFSVETQFTNARDQSKVAEVIPSRCNALTLIDYTTLRDSQWASENDVRVGDLIGGPEDASKIVLASEVDFEFFYPHTQFGFVQFKDEVQFNELIDEDSPQSDSVGGHPFGWLTGDLAVAPLEGGTIAVVPATGRQFVARWIRTHLNQPDTERASPFLHYAVEQATDSNTLAVIAFDLRDAASPNLIEQAIPEGGALKAMDRAEVVQLLSGIEGIALTIEAGEELSAQIEARFRQDASVLGNHSIEILDAMLSGFGAQLKDLTEWDSEIDGEIVTLNGPLSSNALHELLSMAVHDTRMPRHLRNVSRKLSGETVNVMKRPSWDVDREAKSEDEKAREGRDVESLNQSNGHSADATEEYLRRIRRLLYGLQSRTSESLFQSRFWLDRYAFKIQYLDRDNVDQRLLDFADETTRRLRSMAERLESAMVAAAEEVESGWTATPGYRTVNYGGIRIWRRAYFYRGASYGNDPAFTDRLQVLDELNDATVAVRAIGLDIVRDFNVVGEKMASAHDFEFEKWEPGEIR